MARNSLYIVDNKVRTSSCCANTARIFFPASSLEESEFLNCWQFKVTLNFLLPVIFFDRKIDIWDHRILHGGTYNGHFHLWPRVTNKDNYVTLHQTQIGRSRTWSALILVYLNHNVKLGPTEVGSSVVPKWS
jgi:hypothetical protein